MRRFLLLILVPALATCIGVVRMAEGAREARRNDRLERVSNVLATALREDLATAWRFLELETGPLASADTTIGAVRSALQGDTIRALSAQPDGALASVLLLRNDTLRTASGTFRSPLLDRVPNLTPLEVGLYLRGVRVLPRALPPERGGLPDSMVTTAGWREPERAWVTSVASTPLGQQTSQVALVTRYTTPDRAVASVRTLAAAAVLLSLALLSAWMGLTGPSRSSGAVVFSAVLLTGMTMVISGWIALGESRIASADGVRELSTLATLLQERGLLTDPMLAQQQTGLDVIRVTGGEARNADGASPAPFVMDLSRPSSGRPASGQTPDGRIYLAVAGGETAGEDPPGHTILLAAPATVPPLIPVSLLGSLLVMLGSFVVARGALTAAPSRPLGLSE